MLDSRESRLLSAIIKVQHRVGASLDLKEIASLLVDELTDIFKCQGCAFIFIEGHHVKALAEKGFLKLIGNVELTTEMPLIKKIITSKESIFTGDLKNSPFFSICAPGIVMNSLLCAPVIVNGEVRGIIHLDSRELNAFSKDDADFVRQIAKEISVAVERSLMYSEIKTLSIIDSLVGCFNRRHFDEDVEIEIERAKRYNRVLSLLMIDIDWFKEFNDSYGHQKGDELLKRLVDIIKYKLRSVDKLYRYGGEEFMVVAPETDKESTLVLAERLRIAIEQAQFEGEKESQPNHKITITIGVASFPQDADSVKALILAADTALYAAKKSGKNKSLAYLKTTT